MYGIEPTEDSLGFAFAKVETVVKKLYDFYYECKDSSTKALLLLCYREHEFVNIQTFVQFMKAQFSMPNVPDYKELTRRMVDSVQVIHNSEINDIARIKAAHWLRDVLKHCLLDKELDPLTVTYRTTLLDEERRDYNLLCFNPHAVCTFVGLMVDKYDKEDDN